MTMQFPFTWYSWSHTRPTTAAEHRARLIESLLELHNEEDIDSDRAFRMLCDLLGIDEEDAEETDLWSDLTELSECSEQLHELDGIRGHNEAWDFALDKYRAGLDDLIRLSFIAEHAARTSRSFRMTR